MWQLQLTHRLCCSGCLLNLSVPRAYLTRNRIKDISVFLKALSDNYGVPVKFKYVKSEDNPCDLITRGLSFAEFHKKLQFWLNRPNWLANFQNSWPESSLGCLSEDSKQQTQPTDVTASFNVNLNQQSKLFILSCDNFMFYLTGYLTWGFHGTKVSLLKNRLKI